VNRLQLAPATTARHECLLLSRHGQRERTTEEVAVDRADPLQLDRDDVLLADTDERSTGPWGGLRQAAANSPALSLLSVGQPAGNISPR
jgi:hypothetical protein